MGEEAEDDQNKNLRISLDFFFFLNAPLYICEQVLFVRFTIIPPRLTDQCSFITVL